jgi:hypothetical protein
MEASAERARELRRIETVYAAIDQLDSSNFMLAVSVESAGPNQPAGVPIRRHLTDWLDSLDPDAQADVYEDSGFADLSETRWEEDDWIIRFRAIPKSPDKRGSGSVRPIGMRFSRAKRVDTHLRIRRQLRSKATRYGNLRAPLVVAVLTEEWASIEDSTNEALYGSFSVTFDLATDETREFRGADGFWSRPRSRPASVVVGGGLTPWLITKRWPTLWMNPYDSSGFRAPFPFPVTRVDQASRHLVAERSSASPLEYFGLPDGWPGDEDLVLS